MKTFLTFFALLSCFLIFSLRPGVASPDEAFNEALPVAKAWIAQIDAGQYDQSYDSAGEALHQKVSQDKWTMILKTERPLMGKLVSRKVSSHEYKPNGFEGSDGEFLLIYFDSSFEKMPDETEHVVLRREGGKWIGVGYNFGPQQVDLTPPDSNTTTTSSTTTSTPTTPADTK